MRPAIQLWMDHENFSNVSIVLISAHHKKLLLDQEKATKVLISHIRQHCWAVVVVGTVQIHPMEVDIEVNLEKMVWNKSLLRRFKMSILLWSIRAQLLLLGRITTSIAQLDDRRRLVCHSRLKPRKVEKNSHLLLIKKNHRTRLRDRINIRT